MIEIRGVATVVVDITNDGVPDVITANQVSDDITVLVGNGDGSLRVPLRFTTLDGSGGGDGPESLVIADVTGDGVLDAVTANLQSDDVTVLAGMAASPNFGPSQTFSTRDGTGGDNPIDLVVTDVNGDGVADVLTSNNSTHDVSVLLGTGGGAFAAARAYESSAGTTGFGPFALGVGDFTSDGLLDVVVGNRTSGSVTIVPGFGDGVLAPAQTIQIGNDARFVQLAHLDGDGLLDFVIAEHTTGESIRRGLQRGAGDFATGAFSMRSGCCSGDDPASVALGDIDSDSDLDVVTAADIDRGASLARNNGSGSFGTAQFLALSSSGRLPHVIPADITGNNNLDIVGVNPDRDELIYAAGNGAGSFGSPVAMSTTESTSGQGPVFVAAADVNGDSIMDLLTANRDSNDVTLFIGLGSGSFTPPVIVPATFSGAAAGMAALQLGDFNDDGLLDIVTANRGRNDVSIIMGFGNGAFAAPQTFPVGNDPRSVFVGDIDGDGLDDIVTGNFLDDNIVILDGRRSL